MSVYKKLLAVQQELKVPKGQWNNFGKYYYRSCEDIMEAAKPVLQGHNCLLTMQDQIRETTHYTYIESMAILTDVDTNEQIYVSAHAREAAEKKGMDAAQITGSTTSYARKYALSGLFCLDDVKDSDADTAEPGMPPDPKVGLKSEIQNITGQLGVTPEKVKEHIKKTYDKESSKELNLKQLGEVLAFYSEELAKKKKEGKNGN